ncbi:MAG: PAS domain S-box protein [Lentisphaerae bacterium]|nr:PAS domain S-box protein [Lentisphaerota bacterium]
MRRLRPLVFGGVVLALLLALSGGVVWFYRLEYRHLRQQAVGQILTIGQSKARELTHFLEQHIEDGELLMEDPFLPGALRAFMTEGDRTETRAALAQMLRRHVGRRYQNALVLDPAGRPVFSFTPRTPAVDAGIPPLLRQAFAAQRPLLTDLHVDGQGGNPHYGLLVPFLASDRTDAAPLAAVVLIRSADAVIHPLLRSWPVPTLTAETTLSRRDGQEVLFLGPVRHRVDAAFKLRLPLARDRLPEGRAARGYQGVVEGIDYREREVLAYVTQVPHTPWLLVAKQDRDELFADWRQRSRMILVGFWSLALGIIGLAAMVWQRADRVHGRRIHEQESRLQSLSVEKSLILDSIGDAVIAVQADGSIRYMNRTAAELTGWPETEAEGRPLTEVFRIINAETRLPAENPVDKVMRLGVVVGLANHTVLVARDGTERPITDSAAPIRNAKGGVDGVVLVFRDQSIEHDYRTLFQRMLNGFAVHELIYDTAGRPVDYRFLSVNPAFERLTGLQAEKVVGRSIMTVLPQTEPEWIDSYAKVVQTSQPLVMERYSRELDRHFLVTAFQTGPRHFATIFHDVTDRKRMERELIASERKFRSLTDDVLDNTEAAVCVLDASCRVVWLNRAMERYFGLDRDRAIGQDNRLLIAGHTAKAVEDPEAFARRLLASYADNTSAEMFECHVLPHGDRADRWLQHWSQPIEAGIYAGGRIEHYYDISERKRSELELRRLLLAIEQSGDSVMVLDADRTIRYVNQAFEQTTGFTRGEVVGRPIDGFAASLLADDRNGEIWRRAAQGKRFRLRMHNRRKDGTDLAEDVSIAPVFDKDGRLVNYVFVSHDETAQLRMEEELQQAQRLESTALLAGGIAHDFNNMLGVILGNAELALETIERENPAYGCLQAIQKAGNLSVAITQQLLTFASRQIVKPRELELDVVVKDQLKMLRHLLGERSRLVWRPAGSHDWLVKVDPNQIMQILTNLCLNARDAMPDGGTLTIATGRVQVPGRSDDGETARAADDYVTLKVSDTGAGMDTGTQARMFEPFFTTKTRGRGSGLGLATVHGIVQQNGGFIRVRSRIGAGTELTIHLPAIRRAVPAADPPGRAAEPDQQPGRGRTVLVVEDEVAILKVCRAMLERLGFRVLPAATQQAACRLADRHGASIDLLLTDVMMPGMNGIELARHLRQSHPALKVLFMSGYTDDVVARQDIMEAGVCFLQKPFTSESLAASVQAALQGRAGAILPRSSPV